MGLTLQLKKTLHAAFCFVNNNLIFFVAIIFYVITLAPTLIQGDSSALCIYIHNKEIFFGKPDSHPLFIIIGIIFSWLPFSLAYSINLEAAVFGALTVLIVYKIIKTLGCSACSAWFGGLCLMVSHAFWLHSVIAEVYTLNTFFLSLVILITVSRLTPINKKVLFVVVFSAGIFNHLILMISIPAFLIYLLLGLPGKKRLQLFLLCIACLFLFFSLFFLVYFINKQFLYEILRKTLFNRLDNVVYLLPPQSFLALAKELLFYLAYLIYQFPLGCFLLIIPGIWFLWKEEKRITVLLLSILIINEIFFVKTTYWQSFGGTKYTFYISDYVLFSIFIGFGFEKLKGFMANRVKNISIGGNVVLPLSTLLIIILPMLTVMFYTITPFLVTYFKIDLIKARQLAFRDNNRFFLNPNKFGFTGNRDLGMVILKKLPPDGVLFADFTICQIVKYLQICENVNPELRVVLVDENIPIFPLVSKNFCNEMKENLFIADTMSYYDINNMQKYSAIEKYGYVFKIIPKSDFCYQVNHKED